MSLPHRRLSTLTHGLVSGRLTGQTLSPYCAATGFASPMVRQTRQRTPLLLPAVLGIPRSAAFSAYAQSSYAKLESVGNELESCSENRLSEENPVKNEQEPGPLHGVRVVDLTRVLGTCFVLNARRFVRRFA